MEVNSVPWKKIYFHGSWWKLPWKLTSTSIEENTEMYLFPSTSIPSGDLILPRPDPCWYFAASHKVQKGDRGAGGLPVTLIPPGRYEVEINGNGGNTWRNMYERTYK